MNRETFTKDTPFAMRAAGVGQGCSLAEYIAMAVKAIGTTFLTFLTLGATGDLVAALFVGVGYATALICAATLPELRNPKGHVESRVEHP